MGRNIQSWREHVLYVNMLDPIAYDFKEIMEILGADTEEISCVHVPPKRELIDPTKEIPAIVNSIRSGLSTLSDEILAQGKDPREHYKQLKEDKDKLKELGLILDSDASKVMKSGIVQTYVDTDEGETLPPEPKQGATNVSTKN